MKAVAQSLAFLASLTCADIGVARADTLRRIDLPREPLATSLTALARAAGISLIFDPRIIAGVTAPPLHGQMTIDQALKRLIAPAGLIFHHTANGAILIERRPIAPAKPVADVPAPAYPEILVVGRRSLNVAIPRSEDDIQPYQIIRSQQLEESGATSLDGFFKSRLAPNAQALLNSQAPVATYGSTRSLVDLRGLGTSQTLMLVDGHRLPSFPALDLFDQSDINGIPFNAIDRIETLPSTAGGIYGPGATGGVVNIVLKHDARGLDLTGSGGITARGDAPTWRVQLHGGFTSPSGNTKADFFYEHNEEGGLRVGDRAYVNRARVTRFNNLATDYAANGGFPYIDQFPAPYSTSINIVSESEIYLSAKYGGGSIGSSYTFIPMADIGTPQEGAILRANAGKLDFTMPADGGGSKQSLLTRTRRDGGVLTLRQKLGARVELFLDLLAYRRTGIAIGGEYFQAPSGDITVDFPFSDSPNINTGLSTIAYSYPAIANTGVFTTTDTMIQASSGVIARLGRGWQAEADLTAGRISSRSSFPIVQVLDPPDPFSGAASLAAYSASLQPWPYAHERSSDRLLDGSVRLAGPIARLPGGQLTTTLLGDWRDDRAPGIVYRTESSSKYAFLPSDSPGQRLADQALYGEIRAPLLPKDSAVFPLRGLELQGALRSDWYQIRVPRGHLTIDDAIFGRGTPEAAAVDVRAHYRMLAFTLGAKVEPVQGVILRASYATGDQPPDTRYLTTATLVGPAIFGQDPKRGYHDLPDAAIFDEAGSGGLAPSHYRSLLLGAVLEPRFLDGFRLSVDYTRVRSSNEVFEFPSQGGLLSYYYQPQFFLDHEDQFSSRVHRAPLTAADIARGYTGGRVIEIDGSAANSASTRLDALDFNLRYTRETVIGRLELASTIDWILSFRRQTDPTDPFYSAMGYIDGPAPWKGNVSLEWSRGRWRAGGNVQMFGPYRVGMAPDVIGGMPDVYSGYADYYYPIMQGRSTVPAQVYLDGFVSYRIRLAGKAPGLLVRLTAQNLLDKSPPAFLPVLNPFYYTDFGLGYAYQGDPRGRRFAVDISVSF